ncbi:MAG: hypothetical protein ABSE69_10595 [Roseiarcus sp.]
MNGEYALPDAVRLRRHLVEYLRGLSHWAATVRARRNLRAEIDALERAGVLDHVLRDFDMTRSDMNAMLDADPETPRSHEEVLEWINLADRLRSDERRWARDA